MFANFARRAATNIRAPVARNMMRPAAPVVRQPEPVAEAAVPIVVIPFVFASIALYKKLTYDYDEENGEANGHGDAHVKRMRALWKENQPLSTVEGGVKRTDSWKDRDSSASLRFNKEPQVNRSSGPGKLSQDESYKRAELGIHHGWQLTTAAPEGLRTAEGVAKGLERKPSKKEKFARQKSITAVDGISKKYQ